MELTGDEIIQRHARNCLHCMRKKLLPYEYEWTFTSCAYNVVIRKTELSKNSRNKTKIINRLDYAEHKILGICVKVNKIYEDNEYDEIYEALSKVKNKKIGTNNILTEKSIYVY